MYGKIVDNLWCLEKLKGKISMWGGGYLGGSLMAITKLA